MSTWNQEICERNHRGLWRCISACLVLMGVTVSIAAIGAKVSRDVSADVTATVQRAEATARKTATAMKVQVTSARLLNEAAQRQMGSIRLDITDIKQGMKENNRAVMVELKENRNLLMQSIKNGKQ